MIARHGAVLAAALVGCGGSQGARTENRPAHPPVPGEVQRVPGCRWSVWLPQGAVRIPHMSGFVVPDPGIVVVLGDANVPPDQFGEYVDGALGELGRGSELHQTRTTHQGQPARRVSFRGAQNGEALFVSNGTAVGSVHLTAERPLAAELTAQILTSLTLEPDVPFDPAATFGITIQAADGLSPALSVSGLLGWVEQGVQPPLPHGTPILVLVYLPYPEGRPLSDAQLEEAMSGLVHDYHVDPAQVQKGIPTIAGVRAHELVGPGTQDGNAITVYGLLVPIDTGLLAATGSVAADRATDWIARFRRTLASIRLLES